MTVLFCSWNNAALRLQESEAAKQYSHFFKDHPLQGVYSMSPNAPMSLHIARNIQIISYKPYSAISFTIPK